ncbi:MAG: N-6 DNA methylase [Tannerellaceae bacterium]|jgi:type I restriction-modification system DNA methylase subunit|nr:N-6 DNA methylase [Tannerellaceae bacterium]
MNSVRLIHNQLTSIDSAIDHKKIVYQFAKELGWNPGYYMQPSKNESFSNGYLSIESGLENTAVLAFLTKPFNDLDYEEKKALYSVSYNNLVSWLISIDKYRVTYSFILNSTEKGIVEEIRIDGHSYEMLRSEAFEMVVGKRPSTNIKALDDSLISNISRWRRLLSAELNNRIETVSLSSLFNAIIFIRALEDNQKRYNGFSVSRNVLLECIEAKLGREQIGDISKCFAEAAEQLGQKNIPEDYINPFLLSSLNSINPYMFKSIFESFYQNIDGFQYDFSIISKHALSRIYERYVAALHVENPFKLTGSYYTPEYIARFFAKYVLKEIPLSKFNTLKILEPAVGSGIFMRTLLELLGEKCNPHLNAEEIKNAFSNILAIDVDVNACQATELSLALLYLLLYSDFPKLNVVHKESIQYLYGKRDYLNSFDLIISNPPYIRYEFLSNELKAFLKDTSFFSDFSKGKSDLYLAFLKLSVDLLSPGGTALFIIPHSFLINEGAKKLRKYITDNCTIKLLADLSAIPVFGNTGVYSILLIFEKKQHPKDFSTTTILKCKNYVGQALEDIINDEETDNSFYSIYKVSTNAFTAENWLILPNKEYEIEQKIRKHQTISDYLEVSSGIISGCDAVFLRRKEDIPKGEEGIYKPYLGDKEKKTYAVPVESNRYIFYHYLDNGDPIDETALSTNYPNTWEYLNNHKKQLEGRNSQPSKWWMLRSIVNPSTMFIPKIITPELTIIPKFSIDSIGKYVVSHGCYIRLKESFGGDVNLLYYFLGMLNSTPCYWFIANHANKYRGGYNKIQPKSLKITPIPNPRTLDTNKLINFIKLVKQRELSEGIQAIELDQRINILACEFYLLTEEEKSIILGEDVNFDN